MNPQEASRAKRAVVSAPPPHGAGATIETCLESLLGQTLTPSRFEVLLVFNGPDDGARAAARGLARRHEEHRLVLLDAERPSAGAARNLGLDRARGDHVTFVDSDDWVSANYLEELLAAADGAHIPAAGVVDVSPDGVVDANTTVMRQFPGGRARFTEFHRMKLLSSMTVGKLWPRPWIAAHRFDPELRSGEDVAFNGTLLARFSHRFSRYAVTPYRNGALYYRRLTPGSVSRTRRDFDFAVTQRLAVIRTLTQGDQRQPGNRTPLTSALISGQSRFINGYLEQHPDEAIQVLNAVAQADIPGLPVSTGGAYRPIYRRKPATANSRFVIAAGSASLLNRLAPQIEFLGECGVALNLAFVKGNLSDRVAEIPNQRISVVAVPDVSPQPGKTFGARLRAGAHTVGGQTRRLSRKVTSRLLSSARIVGMARIGDPGARDALALGPTIVADDELAPWERLGEAQALPSSAIHRLVLERASERPDVTEPQSAVIQSSASQLSTLPRGDEQVPPVSIWALTAWWLHRMGHRGGLTDVVDAALRHFPDRSASDGFRLLRMLSTPGGVQFDEAVEAMTAAAHAASSALETGELDRAVFLLTLCCELLSAPELSTGSAAPLLLEDPDRLLGSLRGAPAWALLRDPSGDDAISPPRRMTPSTMRERLLRGLRGSASSPEQPEEPVVVQFEDGDDLRVWPLLTDWSRVTEVVYPAEHVRSAVERVLGSRITHVAARVALPATPTGGLVPPPAESARWTLGLVDWADVTKDPLWALEVLTILRKHSSSWRLKLIGDDFPVLATHPFDAQYAAAFRARAVDLADGIEYVGKTNRLPQHLAGVGYALNSSLRETIPAGARQMIAAGATPVIRNWPVYQCVDGAATAFPNAAVVDTPQDAAERILAHSAAHHPGEGGTLQ